MEGRKWNVLMERLDEIIKEPFEDGSKFQVEDILGACSLDEQYRRTITAGFALKSYWFPAFTLTERRDGGFDAEVSADYPCKDSLKDAVLYIVSRYNLGIAKEED